MPIDSHLPQVDPFSLVPTFKDVSGRGRKLLHFVFFKKRGKQCEREGDVCGGPQTVRVCMGQFWECV